MTHWKQKVAMATSYYNGYCQKVSFQYLLAFWSYGGKTLGGADSAPPPGPDRVKCHKV